MKVEELFWQRWKRESYRKEGFSMNKKIIIIEGYLATGKSAFALQLSKSINIPYLIKDTFKIALCKNISVTSRTESSVFSTVTFDGMMYVAERMLETSIPIIIEGNFVPAGVKKIDEAGAIKSLIDRYNYTSLDFKFMGDTRVLHQRFLEREKTAERGEVNKIGMDVPYSTFNQWCHNLDGFDIGGETVRVDTTYFPDVNFNSYINLAKEFMCGEHPSIKLEQNKRLGIEECKKYSSLHNY